MAPRKPEPGSTWTVAQLIGDGPGMILPGTVVKVREVVPADEPGAHNSEEDSVVVEFQENVVGIVETIQPGEPEEQLDAEHKLGLVKATRAYAVGLDQFKDLFTEGKG